jgi:hypothetical protein
LERRWIDLTPALGFNILYIITFLSFWLGSGFTWLLRDPLVLLLVARVLWIRGLRTKVGSRVIFIFYLYLIVSVITYFLTFGVSLEAISAIRFNMMYLFLFLFGLNFHDYLEPQRLLFVAFIVGLICILLGFVEIYLPELLTAIRFAIIGTTSKTGLMRSGLGVGIGSVFGSRVYFGMVLCFTMAISPLFVKRTRVLFLLFCLIVVSFTYSRTAIVTASTIFSFELMSSLRRNLSLRRAILIFVALAVLAMIFVFMPTLNEAIDRYWRSITAMDITLSGRTGLWKELFQDRASIFPNLKAFARSSFINIDMGVSDNAILNLAVTYGYLIVVPLVGITIGIIVKIKYLNEVARRLIILVAFYSVTVDFYFIALVTIPLWTVLGVYYGQLLDLGSGSMNKEMCSRKRELIS